MGWGSGRGFDTGLDVGLGEGVTGIQGSACLKDWLYGAGYLSNYLRFGGHHCRHQHQHLDPPDAGRDHER